MGEGITVLKFYFIFMLSCPVPKRMLHCVYRVFDNSGGKKFGEANKGKQEKVYEIMYKDRRRRIEDILFIFFQIR